MPVAERRWKKSWRLPLPIYEYEHCGKKFEKLKPMSECADEEKCPQCGQMAHRIFSTFHSIWGWILTEQSHHKGAKDEWVQDRPNNDMIVDNRKAPYTRKVF